MFWRRKRRALSSYKTVLGRRLRGMHGPGPHYAVDDVLWAIRVNRFDERYARFAVAMYCTREDFESHPATRGQRYERLRRRMDELVPVPARTAAVGAAAGYAADDDYDLDGYEGSWDASDLLGDALDAVLDPIHIPGLD